NKIRNGEISKSTDLVSEESAEIISTTESSEDDLDLYKRTDNTLKEIKAS
ncbi:10260_t:CDS:2, partial [Funneliformis geosporum]